MPLKFTECTKKNILTNSKPRLPDKFDYNSGYFFPFSFEIIFLRCLFCVIAFLFCFLVQKLLIVKR